MLEGNASRSPAAAAGRDPAPGIGAGRLWLGVLGAPSAWAAHLGLRYALVPVACSAGTPAVLHAVTGACLAAALGAGGLALANARGAGEGEAARFMGLLGLVLSGLFGIIIVAELVPALFQHPCLGIQGPLVLLLAPLALLALVLAPREALAATAGAPGAGGSGAGFGELAALGLVSALALLYALGFRAAPRRSGRRAAAFAGALVALALALAPPLDALAADLFSAHMAQHLLLAVVAAPLLAIASPGPVLLRALPLRLARPLARLALRAGAQRAARALAGPAAAWLMLAGFTWIWHAPALYRAALAHESVHLLEHATMLGSSVLFFRVLVRADAGRGVHPLAAAALAFLAALQGGALGALLTSASVPLYPEHLAGAAARGFDLLEDQALAGILMWVPAGTVYALAAIVLFFRWLRAIADDAGEPGPAPAPAPARGREETPCRA